MPAAKTDPVDAGAAAPGGLSPVLASLLHNGTTIGILPHALRGGRGASRSI